MASALDLFVTSSSMLPSYNSALFPVSYLLQGRILVPHAPRFKKPTAVSLCSNLAVSGPRLSLLRQTPSTAFKRDASRDSLSWLLTTAPADLAALCNSLQTHSPLFYLSVFIHPGPSPWNHLLLSSDTAFPSNQKWILPFLYLQTLWKVLFQGDMLHIPPVL